MPQALSTGAGRLSSDPQVFVTRKRRALAEVEHTMERNIHNLRRAS